MFFNSLSFIFLFVPAVMIGFYGLVPRESRRYLLLAASLVFYAVSGPAYLLLLLADIGWVYTLTSRRSYDGNRLALWLSIAPPLLALGYFKYLVFVLEQVIGVPQSLIADTFLGRIVLPIGISFFTFELVSYAVDRYRGTIAAPVGLINFSLFVTFFPHLVAGPILRYGDVDRQLEDLPRFRLGAAEAREALIQICVGFGLKILLADWMATYLSGLRTDLGHIAGPDAVYLVLGRSLQIYFDFFGYSLIAIGLGRLLGIRLPDNFDRPYESLNPRQFWRRWHMSLSFWLRDYLYFPLGGNNRYVRNILIVFVVCGIWHGAGWNFMLWGAIHALLVIGYHFSARLWDRQPAALQRAVTFALVSLAWLPFFFDLKQAALILERLPDWSSPSRLEVGAWTALAMSAVACFALEPRRISAWLDGGGGRQLLGGAAAALMLVACLLFFDRTATFIYFRF